MVKNVTSLTSNGLRDWIIQRISAVILGLFVVFLTAFLMANPDITYDKWFLLFANPWMRIFTFLTILSLVVHAWVGVWTVLTDYIKPTGLRLFLEVLLVLALFVFLAWGIEIIWGL